MPIALRVAAGYLMVAGGWGLCWTFFVWAVAHPTFWARWSPDGSPHLPVLSLLVDVGYVVAGVGLATGRAWARMPALILLVLGTPGAVVGTAVAVGGDRLVWPIVLWSALWVTAWNALWFSLIYRHSPR